MIRFLVTAPPLPRVTTRPTRGGPSRPGLLTSTIPPLRLLFPAPRTLRKSRGLRSDSYSGSETLPTLFPSRFEHGATGAGAHPVSETVTPFAASHFGLVGAFHQGEGVGERGHHRLRSRQFLCQSRARWSSRRVCCLGTGKLDHDSSPASPRDPRGEPFCLKATAWSRRNQTGREKNKRPSWSPLTGLGSAPQFGKPVVYLGFLCGDRGVLSSTASILAILTVGSTPPILANPYLRASVTSLPQKR